MLHCKYWPFLASLTSLALAVGCSQPVPEGKKAKPEVIARSVPEPDGSDPVPDNTDPVSEQKISEVFSQFADALKEGNPEKATDLTSVDTFNVYEKCRKLALDSSGTNLAELPQLEIIMILQYRYMLSKKELEAMNGRQLFSWAIKEGLVNQALVEGVSIDEISLEGTEAFASFFKGKQKVEEDRFRFVEEDSSWKIDVYYLSKHLELYFETARKQTGNSKIEFAVSSLERSLKKSVPAAILKGPLK
jgi:hypothetical protein